MHCPGTSGQKPTSPDTPGRSGFTATSALPPNRLRRFFRVPQDFVRVEKPLPKPYLVPLRVSPLPDTLAKGTNNGFLNAMTLPNQLTTLRIILVPVFVALLLQNDPYLKLVGVIVFAVASLTDAYDGYHARKYGEVTRLGAFLDPLADKLLITAAFLLYVWQGYLALWMVLLVAARDIIITVLRVYAEFRDRPVVTSREAKYKTLAQNLFAYVVMLFILLKEDRFFGKRVASATNAILNSGYLDYVMFAITVFTVYTGVSYLLSNWNLALRHPEGGR
jgi:CDP-diacylglycerol--glycerol-3-phosphate 3-phosphatidyltransferase